MHGVACGSKWSFLALFGNFYQGTKTLLMNIFMIWKHGKLHVHLNFPICTFRSFFLILASNFIIINSMSCGHGNRCFHQVLNFETCQHGECASSNNSLRQLCQTKQEENNNVDGGKHESCRQCVDKKCGICAAMSLEEAE